MKAYLKKLKEIEEKYQEECQKREEIEISEEEEKRNILETKWRSYKKAISMVKKYLVPLVKLLKRKYGKKIVKFTPNKYGYPNPLNFKWIIEFNKIYFEVKFIEDENYLEIERKKFVGYSKYEDCFSKKAELTEESFSSKIKEVFLDYLNLKIC